MMTLFRFSENESYYVPKELERNDFIEYIQSLPINQHPGVFGLHENADITKDNQETQQVSNFFILTYRQLTIIPNPLDTLFFA